MRITHVIRGDDHLNNTPRHINLFRALGLEPPRYAHIPMIAGPDGAKLSKRHGATSILEYRELGYLPEAMLNYLLRLGWSHGDQEIFSRDEMIALFDLAAVQKSQARFDRDKLNWLNEHYLKSAPSDRLAEGVATQLRAMNIDPPPGALLEPIADAFRDRAQTLGELAEKARVYIVDFDAYDAKAAAKHLTAASVPILTSVAASLESVVDWTAETTQVCIEQVAEITGVGMGKVAQPVRVAVTGSSASPGIGVTLAILGRERSLARLARAIEYASSSA
jgi:glutamyl-tRNA synthetase